MDKKETRKLVNDLLDLADDFSIDGEIELMEDALDNAKEYSQKISLNVSKRINNILKVGYFNATSRVLDDAMQALSFYDFNQASSFLKKAENYAYIVKRDISPEISLLNSCLKSKKNEGLEDHIASFYSQHPKFAEELFFENFPSIGKVGSSKKSSVKESYLN
jgi:hypothetical protein